MSELTELRERLLAQAYLFDEPASYAAGVEDTLAALASLSGDGHALTIDLSSPVPSIRLTAN